jgi:hypothetical protein
MVTAEGIKLYVCLTAGLITRTLPVWASSKNDHATKARVTKEGVTNGNKCWRQEWGVGPHTVVFGARSGSEKSLYAWRFRRDAAFEVSQVQRIEFGECNTCKALRCAYSGKRTLTDNFGNKPWLPCGALVTAIGFRVFHVHEASSYRSPPCMLTHVFCCATAMIWPNAYWSP